MSEEVKQEVIQTDEKKEVIHRPLPMAADESGVLIPKNIEEAYRYASMIVKSGLAPSSFDTPEKVLVAMQTAAELKINPLTSLRNMYIVNGTVNLWGDLPLGLVRRSGFLESFKEIQYDENGKDINSDEEAGRECFKAVCTLKRFGHEPITRSITWKEAQDAGLDKNKWGVKDTYKNHRRRMLQMRARGWALKDEFGDVLQGIAILEYDSYQAKERNVSGRHVDRLNEKYGLISSSSEEG